MPCISLSSFSHVLTADRTTFCAAMLVPVAVHPSVLHPAADFGSTAHAAVHAVLRSSTLPVHRLLLCDHLAVMKTAESKRVAPAAMPSCQACICRMHGEPGTARSRETRCTRIQGASSCQQLGRASASSEFFAPLTARQPGEHARRGRWRSRVERALSWRGGGASPGVSAAQTAVQATGWRGHALQATDPVSWR